MTDSITNSCRTNEDLVRFHYPLPGDDESGLAMDEQEQEDDWGFDPRTPQRASSLASSSFADGLPLTPQSRSSRGASTACLSLAASGRVSPATPASANGFVSHSTVETLPLSRTAGSSSFSSQRTETASAHRSAPLSTTPLPTRATTHRVYDIVVLYGHLPFLHWYIDNVNQSLDIKTGNIHTSSPQQCWQEDPATSPAPTTPRRPPSPEPSRRRGAPPSPSHSDTTSPGNSYLRPATPTRAANDNFGSYSPSFSSSCYPPFVQADIVFHSIYDVNMPALISQWLRPVEAMPPVRTQRQSGPVGVFFGQVLGGGQRRWRAMEWAFDTKCMIAYLCKLANVVVYDLQLVVSNNKSASPAGKKGKPTTLRYHATGKVASADDFARLSAVATNRLLGDHLGFWEATSPHGEECLAWLADQHDQKTKPQFRSEAVEYQAPPPCVAPLKVGKHASQQPHRRRV